MTFAVPNEGGVQSKDRSQTRDERVLCDAYQVYSRRINRILHLLQHLQALGMRSTQEYQGWCTSRGLSDELLKSPQQRRRELELMGAKTVKQGGEWFREVATRICEGKHSEADLQTGYLRRIAHAFGKGLSGERTRVYGYTRSWSKYGSAASVVLAALFVYASDSYTYVFYCTVIPYLLSIAIFWDIPNNSTERWSKRLRQPNLSAICGRASRKAAQVCGV